MYVPNSFLSSYDSDSKTVSASSGVLESIQKGIQQKSWLAGFIFLLIIINIIAASYYCCCRSRNTSSKPDTGDYGPLAGNEPIGMSSIRRGAGGYRDGEDEDADEDRGTRGPKPKRRRATKESTGTALVLQIPQH